MRYAIRWSERIDEDIERGFSGSQAAVSESLEEICGTLGLLEELEELKDSGEVDENETWVQIENNEFRKFNGLWFLFHHEGLSCFEIQDEFDTEEEVIEFALENYNNDEFTPVGDGDRTVGKVKVVACLQEPTESELGCYLISCEDTIPN